MSFRSTGAAAQHRNWNHRLGDVGGLIIPSGFSLALSTQRNNAFPNVAVFSEVNNRRCGVSGSVNGGYNCRAPRGRSAGKIYWEQSIINVGNGNAIGWWRTAAANEGDINGSAALAGSNPRGFSLIGQTGGWNVGSGVGSFTGSLGVSGTGLYMFALDMDLGRLWMGKTGVWSSGDPSTNTSPLVTGVAFAPGSPGNTLRGGFGTAEGAIFTAQSEFTYPLPTGFIPYSTDP